MKGGFGEESAGSSGGRAAGATDTPVPEEVSPIAAPNLVSTNNWSALRGVLDGIV